ncbi:hypothetical protein HYV83_05095 [Candidatus Woesearchaeota archaeon]|nr:hypothetical protein [Candidatus Woesearchaeota archaeon]
MASKLRARVGKGGSFFVPLVVFGAIITLISLLGILYIKSEAIKGGDKTIGEKQAKLFTVYQFGEKHLFFVDESVKKASEAALLEVASSGLEKENSDCKKSGDDILWAKQEMGSDCNPAAVTPCYPSEGDNNRHFNETFKKYYDSYIDSYNGLRDKTLFNEIPKEYASLNVEGGGSGIDLVGKAKDHITISSYGWEQKPPLRQLFEYNITPSFTEPIEVNFVQDSANLVNVAKEIFGKPKDEVTKLVKAADGQNGLDWDEKFSYNKAESPPCTRSVGSCSCCETVETCEEGETDKDGKFVCKKHGTSDVPVGDGVLKESVPYDSIAVPMSVKVNDPESGSGHRQFFVYDEAAKKVVLKELEYRFALSWVEAHPDKATTFCSCGEGHPC